MALKLSRYQVRAAALVLVLTPLFAGNKKLKRIKPGANPPEYIAFSKPVSKDQQFHHALDRLTFGARPGDLEKIQTVGLDKWLNLELHPEKVAENPVLEQRLAPFESLRMSIEDTYARYPRKVQDAGGDSGLTPDQIEVLQSGKPEEKQQLLKSLAPEKRSDFVRSLRPAERQQLFASAPIELRRELMLGVNPQNVVANDLSEGKLLRAIYSNHQLEELLVDFWYNHFNVFLGKGGDRYMVPTYEREAIRSYVFGKFYDLLLETAESPAMLFYLDNWQSVAPGAVQRPNEKNKRGLNENYGRELLELHTLGVDGGYTQKDVIEVARCFTGWTIANPRKGGGFEYNDKVHDKGAKLVLGYAIAAGGGMNDGLAVLDILAHHPSTAHFISLKLAQRFVADDPPPSLVNRMAQAFMKTDGNLREVMRTMLAAPEFWSEGAYNAKVKTPFEMVAGAMRATNADVTSAFLLSNELQKMGEPLYRKVEPTGYSSANAEWVSSAGLLERMNFAAAVAQNRIGGVKVDAGDWQTTALEIGSPEFQRH
ncbi:MAG: DUF1800 domain-containing protein [Bryobacteraceae bacterium]